MSSTLTTLCLSGNPLKADAAQVGKYLHLSFINIISLSNYFFGVLNKFSSGVNYHSSIRTEQADKLDKKEMCHKQPISLSEKIKNIIN